MKWLISICMSCVLLQACTTNLKTTVSTIPNKPQEFKKNKPLSRNEINEQFATLLNKNTQKAKQFLLNRLDDPYCCYLLGTTYLTEKNYKLANKYITQSANAGCLEAINSLADGYYSGDIRQKNITLAQKYYLRAANCGYGPAQINIGSVYFRHGNTVQEMKKALYWFNKAYNNEDMAEFKPYIPMFKSQVKEKMKDLQNAKKDN